MGRVVILCTLLRFVLIFGDNVLEKKMCLFLGNVLNLPKKSFLFQNLPVKRWTSNKLKGLSNIGRKIMSILHCNIMTTDKKNKKKVFALNRGTNGEGITLLHAYSCFGLMLILPTEDFK